MSQIITAKFLISSVYIYTIYIYAHIRLRSNETSMYAQCLAAVQFSRWEQIHHLILLLSRAVSHPVL